MLPSHVDARKLFNFVPDALIVADLSTEVILLWNDGAERLFGYPRAEAIGVTLDSVVEVPEADRRIRSGQRSLRTGKGRLVSNGGPVQGRALRSDGEELDIELFMMDLSSDAGEHFMALIRDVTPRVRLTQALAEANAELLASLGEEQEVASRLRELNRTKDEFVSMLAHDLRSPLGAIHGFASLLQRSGEQFGARETVHFLEAIISSAQRIERLVDDVLEAARIEAGSLPVELRSFDLEETVREAVEELTARFPARAVKLRVAEALPAAIGDPARQSQILANLLSNAAKFSPEDEPIEVQLSKRGDTIQVSVMDRGPGIPEEDRERIFERFSRGRTAGADGTGLGLYITRQLVHSQGGELVLECPKDGGCVFHYTVALPRD